MIKKYFKGCIERKQIYIIQSNRDIQVHIHISKMLRRKYLLQQEEQREKHTSPGITDFKNQCCFSLFHQSDTLSQLEWQMN